MESPAGVPSIYTRSNLRWLACDGVGSALPIWGRRSQCHRAIIPFSNTASKCKLIATSVGRCLSSACFASWGHGRRKFIGRLRYSRCLDCLAYTWRLAPVRTRSTRTAFITTRHSARGQSNGTKSRTSRLASSTAFSCSWVKTSASFCRHLAGGPDRIQPERLIF